ncbi:MAG: DUF3572 domain-containing protein [Alphaproteobacteria bacterium]|nr:DUF3572 domain-containing protein [Alphaproteobacteria bacterium]
MTYEQAELIGLQALVHVTGYEEILIAYLKLSGITLEELRESAADPAVLGSILDYFLQNEKRLIAFSEATEIPPDQLTKARALLPGGEIIPENL